MIFEPGRRYTEADVNVILAGFYDDTATVPRTWSTSSCWIGPAAGIGASAAGSMCWIDALLCRVT